MDSYMPAWNDWLEFLSSNTQDFIEVWHKPCKGAKNEQFLSSNTQDFIEVDGMLC